MCPKNFAKKMCLPPKNFGTNKFLGKKYFGWKKFWAKKFKPKIWATEFFGPKQIFGANKIFEQKKFFSKIHKKIFCIKNVGQKNWAQQIFFRAKTKFWPQKNIAKNLNQKNFGAKKIFQEQISSPKPINKKKCRG